jgi:hypothetical protein
VRDVPKIYLCGFAVIRVLEFPPHLVHVLLKELYERMGTDPTHDVIDAGEGSIKGCLDGVVSVVVIGSFVL